MSEIEAKNLRAGPPRRWSDELGGIAWLPRLIDKARAAMAGTLGDYLYGQSPFDRGLLSALGLTYRDFTTIVRRAGSDDDKVLALLQLQCDKEHLELARRWSQELHVRHRPMLYLIDLDDGYVGGPLELFQGVIRLGAILFARYLRYRSPAKAAFIGLEVQAQRSSARADAARGAQEEPYTWLNEARLTFALKLLLTVVLAAIILGAILRFVERIGLIAVIIIGAIFFAYLVYPIVRWLNRKLHLIVAILLVYAAIAGIAVAGMMFLVPRASAEIMTLVHDWPSLQARMVALVRDPHNTLLMRLPPFVREQIAQLPITIPKWVQVHGLAAFGNAVSVLLTTATFLGAAVAIPILAAYLLFDSETIKRFVMGFVPPVHRESSLDLLSELENVIGGFIRGQLLVGLTVGILIAIGLVFVGEPYAIVIGAVAAVLDFIPYIGPVIAAVPAIILALVNGGTPLMVKVLVVFIIANQLEGHIIAPNIVSRTIALSPSAVVISILIGGELYGVLGMFVAVPIAAVIRVILLRVIPGSVSREEAKPVLTKDPHDTLEEAASS